VKYVQFNCPGYDNDLFKTNFSFLSFVIIVVAFLFTIVVNLGQIIVEKESKMKVKMFFVYKSKLF